MKPIVTDTYDFPTLIRRGYVYVDKTALLHRLVSGVDGLLFFMSRPRRFGKSLMISTLEQIFSGKRELFKGLAIERTDYDWAKYPIIRLDMTAFDQTSGLEPFKHALAEELGGEEPIAAFRALIARKAKASRGKGVVILIDEYDSPVSGLLGKSAELEAMREFLQAFYRILKQEVASIRFLMMTGVSKFTKLSVFSGLNNLNDLSMDPNYAGLLGYTPEELNSFFRPQIEDFAGEAKLAPQQIVDKLLAWYDGYRFSPKSEIRVCNPVSVGCALRTKSFEPFWDRTGSATLIVERLRKLGKMPFDIEKVVVAPKRLDICDLRSLPFAVLMYQGGYLTIKSVQENGNLELGIPNKEVREAIYGGFLDEVLKDGSDAFSSSAIDLRNTLETPEAACVQIDAILTAVFAMVPHEWKLKSEAEAKRYFLLFMRMAGATINAEVESSTGRADAILETAKAVYIFEFKYGKTAKAALRQCRDRDYAAPYAVDRRTVLCVGVNYNPKMTAVETVVETINETINRKGETINETIKGLVTQTPGIKVADLTAKAGRARSTIMRAMAVLIQQGEIEYRGSKKTGGYFARGR